MPASTTWLWRLFSFILMLQAGDLLTTYMALASGRAHEGNVFLRKLISTPGAPALKAGAILALGALMVGSLRYGRPAPRRLIVTMGIILLLYVGIVANNVWVLLAR